MGDRPQQNVTLLLANVVRGDSDAREQLAELTYRELKLLARQQLGRMGRAGPAASLQPTVLTHEAWSRLFHGENVKPSDRRQFFGLAAKVMRDFVIDHARAQAAVKRGGRERHVTLQPDEAQANGQDVDIFDLTTALDELRELDPRQHSIVELRYFAGLGMEDIAHSLEVSLSTVEREWRAARAWLGARLRPED